MDVVKVNVLILYLATNRGSPHRLTPPHLRRGHSKNKTTSYHGYIRPGVPLTITLSNGAVMDVVKVNLSIL